MASKVLVVGSGAIGLRTALELLRRNVPIKLRSARPPLHPSTCSMGAGGLWMPYHCPDPRIDRWAIDTLEELLPLADSSLSYFSSSVSVGTAPSPVEIVPVVVLKRNHGGPTVHHFIRRRNNDEEEEQKEEYLSSSPLPKWTSHPRLSFQHLSSEMLWWQNNVHKLRLPSIDALMNAGYGYAWLFHAPIVDPPRMLARMLQDVMEHPLVRREDGKGKYMDDEGDDDHDYDDMATVNVDTGRYYQSMDEMIHDAIRLGCDGVVNCTGLGSRELCGDDCITGGRGVLLHFDRRHMMEKMGGGGNGSNGGGNGDKISYPNDCCIMVDDEEGEEEKGVGVGVRVGTSGIGSKGEKQPWSTGTETCYVIPRGKVLCVGGTYHEGDTEPTMREEERSRLLLNANRLLGGDTGKGTSALVVQASDVVSEWVGFRPSRHPVVRLEVDNDAAAAAAATTMMARKRGVRVVHNYGHGGSGWTVFVGAAREAADLVLNQQT